MTCLWPDVSSLCPDLTSAAVGYVLSGVYQRGRACRAVNQTHGVTSPLATYLFWSHGALPGAAKYYPESIKKKCLSDFKPNMTGMEIVLPRTAFAVQETLSYSKQSHHTNFQSRDRSQMMRTNGWVTDKYQIKLPMSGNNVMVKYIIDGGGSKWESEIQYCLREQTQRKDWNIKE